MIVKYGLKDPFHYWCGYNESRIMTDLKPTGRYKEIEDRDGVVTIFVELSFKSHKKEKIVDPNCGGLFRKYIEQKIPYTGTFFASEHDIQFSRTTMYDCKGGDAM